MRFYEEMRYILRQRCHIDDQMNATIALTSSSIIAAPLFNDVDSEMPPDYA